MTTHTQKLFGTGEVARMVGLPRWKLIYLIESRELPEASLRIAGRRLFTEEDIQRLVAAHEAAESEDAATEEAVSLHLN